MTSEQAYPSKPSYEARALQKFEIGDKVSVGPGYRMGGSYEADGCEGEYFVVGVVPGVPADYKLARHPDDSWQVIVHPSRMLKV